MALDVNNLMSRLNPMRPLDFGNGQQLEQMRLLREKFEEEKRQNREQEKLKRLQEQNDMAQAELALQQKQEEQAAARQAALLAKQQEAQLKFGEAAGAGNVALTDAMVPYLNSLGVPTTELGRVDGMPSYQVGADPRAPSSYTSGEAADIGYPTNERGTLDDPSTARPLSTEEAFRQAQAASEFAENTGAPMRAPAEPDYMGAVPKNVIDMGASQAATLSRLNPGLKSFVESYPKDFRPSAEKTAEMVQGAGLPLDKSYELFRQSRTSPDNIIQAQIAAQAQQDRFREERDQLKPTEEQGIVERGFNRAQQSFKDNKVGDTFDAIQSADTVVQLMTNDDNLDDEKAVNYLMQMAKNKGPQTERDAERVVGIGTASTVDQIKAFIKQAVDGGYYDKLKESIVSFAMDLRQKDQGNAFSYLDNMNKQARGNKDPRVAQGYQEYLDQLPQWIRDEYEDHLAEQSEKTKDAGAAPQGMHSPDAVAPVGDDDFDFELEAAALEGDLDPDKIRPLIRHESGGKAGAVSTQGASGILQIMPDNLRAMGIEPEAFRKLSATEQLPYALRYFKDRGIDSDSSPEDYAMAVAASDPKFRGAPDETVVYPKGSKAWKANKPWRPDDDGDITVGSILRFYGLRESAPGGGAAAPRELPAPKNELDKAVLDILR